VSLTFRVKLEEPSSSTAGSPSASAFSPQADLACEFDAPTAFYCNLDFDKQPALFVGNSHSSNSVLANFHIPVDVQRQMLEKLLDCEHRFPSYHLHLIPNLFCGQFSEATFDSTAAIVRVGRDASGNRAISMQALLPSSEFVLKTASGRLASYGPTPFYEALTQVNIRGSIGFHLSTAGPESIKLVGWFGFRLIASGENEDKILPPSGPKSALWYQMRSLVCAAISSGFPLHVFAVTESIELLKAFLSFCLWNPFELAAGTTPLHLAAAVGSEENVREIIKFCTSSQDLLVKDKHGLTPSDVASLFGFDHLSTILEPPMTVQWTQSSRSETGVSLGVAVDPEPGNENDRSDRLSSKESHSSVRFEVSVESIVDQVPSKGETLKQDASSRVGHIVAEIGAAELITAFPLVLDTSVRDNSSGTSEEAVIGNSPGVWDRLRRGVAAPLLEILPNVGKDAFYFHAVGLSGDPIGSANEKVRLTLNGAPQMLALEVLIHLY
jgi:hypothetical protein